MVNFCKFLFYEKVIIINEVVVDKNSQIIKKCLLLFVRKHTLEKSFLYYESNIFIFLTSFEM